MLSDNCLRVAFGFLSIKEIYCTGALVCKRWNHISKSRALLHTLVSTYLSIDNQLHNALARDLVKTNCSRKTPPIKLDYAAIATTGGFRNGDPAANWLQSVSSGTAYNATKTSNVLTSWVLVEYNNGQKPATFHTAINADEDDDCLVQAEMEEQYMFDCMRGMIHNFSITNINDASQAMGSFLLLVSDTYCPPTDSEFTKYFDLNIIEDVTERVRTADLAPLISYELRDDFHRAYFKISKSNLKPIVWGRFQATREAMLLFSQFKYKFPAKFIYVMVYTKMTPSEEPQPLNLYGFSFEGHRIYF